MVIRSLLKPKLWITLASLAFIAVALLHQGQELRQINLEPRGWWLLLLGQLYVNMETEKHLPLQDLLIFSKHLVSQLNKHLIR